VFPEEENWIRMEMRKVECEVDWIKLAQDRAQWLSFLNTVISSKTCVKQRIF